MGYELNVNGKTYVINEGDSYKDLINKHKDLKSLALLFDLIDSKTEGGDGKVDKYELDLLQKALSNFNGGNLKDYDVDKYTNDYFKSGQDKTTFFSSNKIEKKEKLSDDGKTSQRAFNQYIQNLTKKYDKEVFTNQFNGKTVKIDTGMTLYKIAKEALENEGKKPRPQDINERMAQIVLVNNIKDVNNIKLGTELKVQSANGAAPVEEVETTPEKEVTKPTTDKGKNPNVDKGTSVYSNAGYQGLSEEAVKKLNTPSSINIKTNTLVGTEEALADGYTKVTNDGKEVFVKKYADDDSLSAGVNLSAETLEEVKNKTKAFDEAVQKIKEAVQGETEEAAKTRKEANLQALKELVSITNGNLQVIKNVANKLRDDNYVDRTSDEYKAFVQDLLLTRNADVINFLFNNENGAVTTVLEKDKTAHEILAGIYQEIRAKEKDGKKLTDEEIKLKEEVSNLKSVNGYKIESDSTNGVHEKYMDFYNIDGILRYYSIGGYATRDPKLLDTFLTELDAADTDEKKAALFKKYIDTKDPELAKSLAFKATELKAKDEDIIALINNNGLEVIDYLNINIDINSKDVVDAVVAKAKEIYTLDKGNLGNAVYLDFVMNWINETDLSDEDKKKAKIEILETYFEVTTDNDGNKTYTFKPLRRPTYEEMENLSRYYYEFNKALVKYVNKDDMGKGQYNEALEKNLSGPYTVPHYAEMVDKMNTKKDVIDFIDNKVATDKNYHLPFDKIVEKYPNDKDIVDRLVKFIDESSTISDETKTKLVKQYMKIDGNNVTFDKSNLPQGVDVTQFVNNILPSNCTKSDAEKYFNAVLKTLGKNDLDLIAGAKSKNPTAVKNKIAELVKSNQNDKDFIQKVAKLDKELIPFGELYNIDAQKAQWDDATKSAVFELLDNGVKYNERNKYLNNAVNKHWVTKVAQDRYAIGDTIYRTDGYSRGEDKQFGTKDDTLILIKLSKTGYEHGQAMFKELEGAGSGNIAKMLRGTEKGFENYVTPDNVTGIIDGFYSKSPNEGIMQYIANEWIISSGAKPGKALCNRIPKALMRKAASLKLQNTEEYKKLADFFGCSNDGKFNFSKNYEAGERYDETTAKQLDLLILELYAKILYKSNV